MKQRVAVGLSGGVDSSVAAYLLKEQGYEVMGVTMLTRDGEERQGEVGSLGPSPAEDAARVAAHLRIPHYVLDLRREFKRCVTDYFVEEYLKGRTPNPCVVCNRYVKWGELLDRSLALGADYIATGHYARIDRLPGGRYALRNSVTAAKDQTYALYALTQEQLSRTLMPVGAYAKEEIRRIALEAGLPVADKPDSQEICFVPDDDYAGFVRREAGERTPGPGNFVDGEGHVLGRHRGITHYTIGQRRGLGLAMGHRVFVTAIRPETAEVVVGEDADLYTDRVVCGCVNFMAEPCLDRPVRARVKIRYNHPGEYCMIESCGEGLVQCLFERKVRAAAPGQAAVFYLGEYVLGGGVIL